MRYAIGVCTRNRQELLQESLERLLATIQDRDDIDVIVVDNGSTDGTPQLLAALARAFPQLQVLVEPTPGLSRARNALLRHTKADVVLMTDDDVLVADGWTRELCAAFDDPSVIAAGGPVTLAATRPLPRWLTPRMASFLAACDYGPAERVLTFPETPVGANMAYRTALLKEIGGFNPNLGHRGRWPSGYEEGEVFAALARHPGKVVWVPGATVEHKLPPHRLTRRYVLLRMASDGFARGVSSRGALTSAELKGLRRAWRSEMIRARKRHVITQLRSREWQGALLTELGEIGFWCAHFLGSARASRRA